MIHGKTLTGTDRQRIQQNIYQDLADRAGTLGPYMADVKLLADEVERLDNEVKFWKNRATALTLELAARED